MPTHRIRRRSERAGSRRRQPASDIERSDDTAQAPRGNFGWAVAVAVIAAGILWLARANKTEALPELNTNGPAADQTPATTGIAETGATSPSPAVNNGRREPAALQALEAMGQAYAQLNAYEDQTRMRIRFPVGNRIQEDDAQLSFQFQRPNQVRLEVEKEAHRVVLVNDGEHWKARILDPTTDNFDNQFVVSPAAELATTNALYEATEYVSVDRPNEMLNALMSLPAPLLVSQIAFLLEPEIVTQMIASSSDIRSLSEQSTQGRQCDRVRLTTTGGSFVFWIDQRDRLLRRIQFPTSDRQPGTPTTHLGKSMLQSDYGRIRLPHGFPPETFQLFPPDGARVLRNFVLPPQKVTDSPINQQVRDFWFTDLRNQRTPGSYWEGKLGVFVWWNHDPSSRAVLEQMSQVYERLANDRRVAMLAVSSIPATQMSHEDVQRIAEQWDIALPVVRDLEAFGRDKFHIEQPPSIVIIDQSSRVQLHEMGGHDQLADQVETVIEKLLAGENLAEQYLTFLNDRDEKYGKLLAAAGLESPRTKLSKTTTVEPPRLPNRLRLNRLWTNKQVAQPGNILSVGNGSRQQLLVHSGLDRIVSLSSYGGIDETIEPRVPGQLLMTTLRSASDRSGRRFYLALAHQATSIHVFDDRWQHLLSYPASDQAGGVQDARLADLDDDGMLEIYVALTGDRGLHRVNWEGRREWTNQTVAPVLSLTISPDNSGRNFLLVTNDRGNILPLDEDGASQAPIEVPSRSLHHLVAAPTDKSQATGYCGVSQLPDGSLVAVGLSANMTEQWSQPLSRGLFESPVDFLQVAPWGERNEPSWLLATPVGTIHIVSQDGRTHDKFSIGAKILGLAGFQARDTDMLVIATEQGITAWEVAFPVE